MYRAMLARAAAHPDPWLAARNVALLHLLYDLALRRGEVATLAVQDVDLTAGTLAIIGKGRTQAETLTLPTPTRVALQAWLDVRGPAAGPCFLRNYLKTAHSRLSGLFRAWLRWIYWHV